MSFGGAKVLEMEQWIKSLFPAAYKVSVQLFVHQHQGLEGNRELQHRKAYRII